MRYLVDRGTGSIVPLNDDPLWNEYSDTWTNTILTVATDHRYRNGVAE